MDPVLRGLFASPARLANTGLAPDLTERLFEAAHAVALDLGALNIQRGRDHGLPPYTAWLNHCGLGGPGNGWAGVAGLVTGPGLARLQAAYTDPDTVDLWAGLVVEARVEGGRVGPTTRCLLVDQFRWQPTHHNV